MTMMIGNKLVMVPEPDTKLSDALPVILTLARLHGLDARKGKTFLLYAEIYKSILN